MWKNTETAERKREEKKKRSSDITGERKGGRLAVPQCELIKKLGSFFPISSVCHPPF